MAKEKSEKEVIIEFCAKVFSIILVAIIAYSIIWGGKDQDKREDLIARAEEINSLVDLKKPNAYYEGYLDATEYIKNNFRDFAERNSLD